MWRFMIQSNIPTLRERNVRLMSSLENNKMNLIYDRWFWFFYTTQKPILRISEFSVLVLLQFCLNFELGWPLCMNLRQDLWAVYFKHKARGRHIEYFLNCQILIELIQRDPLQQNMIDILQLVTCDRWCEPYSFQVLLKIHLLC